MTFLPAHPWTASHAARAVHVPRRLRVMVVEGEAIIAYDLCDAVEDAGHRIVSMARSGSEALAAARRLMPDAALIDLRPTEIAAGRQIALRLQRTFAIRSVLTGLRPSEARGGDLDHLDPIAVIAGAPDAAQLRAALAGLPGRGARHAP